MPGRIMDYVRFPLSQHPEELTYLPILPLAGQNMGSTAQRLCLSDREFPLATENLLRWH
jgi:hypothetical protein